ncbi:HDOD domain-containing protein [Kaarinaea lacus]
MALIKTAQATPELIARFIPFSECSEEELIVLADHSWVDEARQGHILIEMDSTDEWDYYLVEGTLRLAARDGRESFIMGGSRTARMPVAHLQPRQYRISAMTPVTYLRVDRGMLKNLSYGGERTGVVMDEAVSVQDITENPLFAEIYDDLINDHLVVPSMPEVAIKIRSLIDVEDAPIPQIARVINTDPAISAKLVKSANGALYHGQPPVDTCVRAISRLGLNTTKHLVVSFVMRNLFSERIKTELNRRLVMELWNHSVEIAAISAALARVTPGIDPDEALLAGLLHDIGELVILTYAEIYPEISSDEKILRAVVSELKPEIGAFILREWQFPEEFIEVAYGAEEWTRDSGDKPDYCDIVLAAQVHSFFGTPKMKELPPLDQVPAFSKVAEGNLVPEASMKILEEAKEQIMEIRQLLLS